MPGVRVRFSPAPSGSLHLGGARTALFNWLFARHHGGTFILRIEDTDAARSTEASAVGFIEALRWLGLDWDEGPFHQSSRHHLYRAAVERLLEAGRAYECYCTEEEVRGRNETAVAAGRPPGYDGRCRDLTGAERDARTAEGRSHVVRFRTPDEGTSRFTDALRGEVHVEWALIPDFVIQRADGSPIFFLANAVDDIDMQITHVIRGEDLLDSTHRVLALREALGAPEPPVYAHLPLIVDAATRAKLSKRHGAVAVEGFAGEGYLREALVNYIALLGWAPSEGDEVLSADELVAAFDLDRVTHAAAAFDRQKLDWMNGEWIRRLSLDELAARGEEVARARFGGRYDHATFRAALALGQERAVTLASLIDQMDFLFNADDDHDFAIADESWERLRSTERAGEVLDAAAVHLTECEWNVGAIDLRPALEALGTKPRKAMPALYAAIEGRHAGLPLFDSIHLLGRERSLRRLRAARSRLG